MVICRNAQADSLIMSSVREVAELVNLSEETYGLNTDDTVGNLSFQLYTANTTRS